EVWVGEKGKRDELLLVEEHDEPDIAAARRSGDLVAATVVLVREIRAETERVDAEPWNRAVHRLEEVVLAAAEVGVRVRPRAIDGFAVRDVLERVRERRD